MKLLNFFALYTCKQGTNTSIHRIADQIARESSKPKSMKPDLFEKTINMICKLATTRFMKAVVETGYLENLYSTGQYESLDLAIDQICLEFTQEVFLVETQLEKSEWMKKSHSSECAWLFSFNSIREKVYHHAGIEMLHINT